MMKDYLLNKSSGKLLTMSTNEGPNSSQEIRLIVNKTSNQKLTAYKKKYLHLMRDSWTDSLEKGL